MEPEPPRAAFFCLEPESAPGPWRPGAGAGAAQKSGGSATLIKYLVKHSWHSSARMDKGTTVKWD